MRVLVCGSRSMGGEKDFAMVCSGLNRYGHEADVIIHGGATGVDSMAGDWAESHSIQQRVFPANWRVHGRAAGPIRNKQMLVEGKPDMVIAFPGGRGTADMIRQAKTAGITVQEIST